MFDATPMSSESSPMAYDSETQTLSIWSEDANLVGMHDITVSAYLTDYPDVKAEVSGTVEVIERCATINSVTAPEQSSLADYLYTGEMLTFTINPFLADPDGCEDVVYTCEVISGSRTDLCDVNEGSTTGVFDAVAGTYQFSSTDKVNFEPDEYVIQITGIVRDKAATTTFSLNLVDLCPTATLTLKTSPFADQTISRREDYTQTYSIESLVTSSIEAECGSKTVEFFNDDGSAIDEQVFSATQEAFTVTQAVDGDYRYGSYPIMYRVYYTDYPDVSVEQTAPFTFTVADPCQGATLTLGPLPFSN